jgi:hypothetical protein
VDSPRWAAIIACLGPESTMQIAEFATISEAVEADGELGEP